MSAADELVSNLHRAAAISHRATATSLEDLMARLGRGGLEVEEWNALVLSAAHHRQESVRREMESGASREDAVAAMLDRVR